MPLIERWRRDDRYLTGFEIAALAFAAPFLLFPAYRPRLTALALALLAFAWLLRWLIRGEPFPVTPFNAALLLLALMIPVSVWASAFPDVTLPKLTGLILGLAAFRATAWFVRDRRTLDWALAAFGALGLAILAGGALGVGWPDKIALLHPLVSRLHRTAAADINPNQLGGAMALYVPIAAGAALGWLRERRRVPALLSLLGFGLAAGTLLLTQSRGGIAGAAAGLAALPILAGLSHPRKSVRAAAVVVPLALALTVAAAAVGYLGPEHVRGLLDSAFSGNGMASAAGTIRLAGRVEIWSRALYAIQDFPFTGCGLGAFRRVVNLLYPLFLISPETDIAHAHNIFLQTALDLGLPGLVAYLALLWVAVAAAFGGGKEQRRERGAAQAWIARSLACGIIALHVFGMTDALALGAKPGLAFWLALGLIAGLAGEPGHDEGPCPVVPEQGKFT